MFPVAFASYCKWIYDLLYIFGDWNSLWGNLFTTFFGFLGICKRTRRSVLIKSVEVVEMVQDQDQCGWKWHKPCDNWDMSSSGRRGRSQQCLLIQSLLCIVADYSRARHLTSFPSGFCELFYTFMYVPKWTIIFWGVLSCITPQKCTLNLACVIFSSNHVFLFLCLQLQPQLLKTK